MDRNRAVARSQGRRTHLHHRRANRHRRTLVPDRRRMRQSSGTCRSAPTRRSSALPTPPLWTASPKRSRTSKKRASRRSSPGALQLPRRFRLRARRRPLQRSQVSLPGMPLTLQSSLGTEVAARPRIGVRRGNCQGPARRPVHPHLRAGCLLRVQGRWEISAIQMDPTPTPNKETHEQPAGQCSHQAQAT